MKKITSKILVAWIGIFFLLVLAGEKVIAQASYRHAHKRILKLMGSRFELVAIAKDSVQAKAAVDSAIHEIQRIENLISSWLPDSETSQVNREAAQHPVKVSRELWGLLYRAIKVSKLTQGAFDISFASLEPLWSFEQQEITHFPDSQAIARSKQGVGYQNIILNRDSLSVFFQLPKLKIGLGAIGKGYAANQARKRMRALGIQDGLVNAGGDLTAWGFNQDGDAWQIGIADPQSPSKKASWLQIQDQAVVTSGNYEKYFIYKGQHFGHIIDPRTGFPVKGVKSVSIVCPDAELADALATAVYVLGKKEGIALIDRLKGIECLIIDENNIWHHSKNLELNFYDDKGKTQK